MMLNDKLLSAIARRQQETALRERAIVQKVEGKHVWKEGRRLVSFASNDYLGLSQDPRHEAVVASALKRYGYGGQSSQMVSGHTEAHRALEEALADFLQCAKVLCFSNGYMANLGALSALVNRSDALFVDKLCHASLIDAARLSGGDLYRYPHADLVRLEKKLLNRTSKHTLIVSDTVFSMHGDIAPIGQISQLAKKAGATLFIDDAHGFGVLGKAGRGTLEHFGLDTNAISLQTITFGKALGSYGACVASNHELFEYLLQFARSYTYTTALPPLIAEVTRFNLEMLKAESWRREHLHSLIERWRQNAKELQLPVADSITPIQPVLMGDNQRTMKSGEALQKKGFWVGSIRPPTVPNREARLRISLTASHSMKDIDDLSEALADVIHEVESQSALEKEV